MPSRQPFARPILIIALALTTLNARPARAADFKFDPSIVERITGLTGTRHDAEGVFKVSSPRTDIPVTVDGWKMPPFMGLTSWAAFTAGGNAEAMVMGDLVLFEDEVNPVMSAALSSGLAVTALHNHFFFDQPKVYFMHIGGEGTATALATGVRSALDAIKQVRSVHPEPARSFGARNLPAQNSVSAAPLEKILDAKAQQNSGMAKFVFGREVAMECGCTVGKEMGVNTWAAFAGSDDDAVVDGDFATTSSELQAVLKALRAGGIAIVAIHHHMTEETPRIIFLHYWGRGKPVELATTLKNAMATQRK